MTFEDDHSQWPREKLRKHDRFDDARSAGGTRSWGWRIPVLVIVVLILIGLFILQRL